jgi:hypothetical protein
MATTTLREEHYGIPAEDIAPEDFAAELEDCGAGLSDDSLLHWPARAEPRQP